MHWLATSLWRRFPDVTVSLEVGSRFKDLSAVGDGLADAGVFTPAAAARMCFDGLGRFETPRPSLRAIGVVPHRDALVLGVRRDLGLTAFDQVAERRAPLRLSVPLESMLTGHASREALALHGVTPDALASWGGQWIDAPSAQVAWKMVANGEADAMINESLPQAFRPLAKAVPIRLLSMRPDAARQLEERFGYRPRHVPAGNVQGQEEAVLGLSWEHWIVVAHASLAEEFAYALADAFLTDTHALERQYTADNRLAPEDCSLEAPMRPEVVAGEVTIPLHPGAARRYAEAGLAIPAQETSHALA